MPIWNIKKKDDGFIVTHIGTEKRLQFGTEEDAEAFIQKNFVTPSWYQPVSEAADWNNTVEQATHETPAENLAPDQNELEMRDEMKKRL